jgi:DHA1 family multidrug resistance protein-like MFS transporter
MADLLRSRNVTLMLATCVLFGFVLGLGQLVVPLYTLTLSDSPLVLAAVVGVFPLTGVLLSLVTGAISESLGSRAMIVSAFTLMGTGCLVLAAAPSWHVVLVGQFLLGLGDVCFWVPAYAFLSHLAPPGRQYAVQGLGAAAQQTGTIVGPFVGGFLIGMAGFPPAFLLGAVLAAAGLLMGVCLKRVERAGRGRTALLHHLIAYHRGALGALVHNRAVLWATLSHAAVLLTWPVMRGSFYLSLLAARGLSSADVGTIVAAHLLVGSLAGIGLSRLSPSRSMPRLVLAITVVGALTMGATPLLHGIPLIAAVACAGGIVALYMPILIGFLTENAILPERSMGVALLNLSWAVVNPTGVFLVGLLVDRTSLPPAFFVTETVVLVAVGLLWISTERLGWARIQPPAVR